MEMGKLDSRNRGEYKKTYKPLIGWIVTYVPLNIIIIMAIDRLLPVPKEIATKASVLFSLLFMVLALYMLMLMIYRGEYVYWINGGPSFKEAHEMTSEERRAYAGKYVDVFLRIMIVL